MSIAGKLTELDQVKDDLVAAIRTKGGTVSAETLNGCVAAIPTIPSGGTVDPAVLQNVTTTTIITGVPIVSTAGKVETTLKLSAISVPSSKTLNITNAGTVNITSNTGKVTYAGWEITVLDSGELSFKKV